MTEFNYTPLVSKTFNLLHENIDTDQIIPAQFLTTTTRTGLGKLAFYNWRFENDGQERPQHPFTDFNPDETAILVAGNNFGCGSSREHAPWALLDMGFKAILATEIADIFRNNSIKNGLLPIVIDTATYTYLSNHPECTVTLNLLDCSCDIDGYGKINFLLDQFSQYCLSRDYDQLDYLLENLDKAKQFGSSNYSF